MIKTTSHFDFIDTDGLRHRIENVPCHIAIQARGEVDSLCYIVQTTEDPKERHAAQDRINQIIDNIRESVD